MKTIFRRSPTFFAFTTTRDFGRRSGASAFLDKKKGYSPRSHGKHPKPSSKKSRKQRAAGLSPHGEPGVLKKERVHFRKAWENVILDRVPETLSLASGSSGELIGDEDLFDRSHYDEDGVHYYDQDEAYYEDMFHELMDDSVTSENMLGMKEASVRKQIMEKKETDLYLNDEALRSFERSVVDDVAKLGAVGGTTFLEVPLAVDQKLNNLIRKMVHRKRAEIREKEEQLAIADHSEGGHGSVSDDKVQLRKELNSFIHPSNLLTYLLEVIKIPNLASIPPRTLTAVLQSCPNVDVAMKLVDELVVNRGDGGGDILTSRLMSILVSLCISNNNDLDGALTILRGIHKKHPSVTPSKEAYTTLIWACAKIAKNSGGQYSNEDKANAVELGWTLWKEVKFHNIEPDEGIFNAVINCISQVGQMERCVGLLEEMSATRSKSHKIHHDIHRRRMVYKDCIRSVVRGCNINTRYRGVGKYTNRTKKELTYYSRIVARIIEISKQDVDLEDNGGLLLDGRVFAALGAVCGAVGDGNGAIACFRARDKIRQEILEEGGDIAEDFDDDDRNNSKNDFESLRYTTILSSFRRSISPLGRIWTGFENGGFLDATTVDLIDRGASRDAPPVGYRPVDNESIKGLGPMEAAIANMEWDDFDDDDKKSVKGKKWLEEIKTGDLELENQQLNEKRERDVLLLEKIEEARLLLEEGYEEDSDGERGAIIDVIPSPIDTNGVSDREKAMTTIENNNIIENEIHSLKNVYNVDLMRSLPATELIVALRDPLPDDYKFHDIQNMYVRKGENFFSEAVEKGAANVQVCNARLGILCASGKIRDAMRFFYEGYGEVGVQRDRRSARILTEGLCKAKRYDEALHLKGYCERELGFSLDAIGYGWLIRTLCNHDEYGSGLLLLEECHEKNGSVPGNFFLRSLTDIVRKRSEISGRGILKMTRQMDIVPEDPAAWAKIGQGRKGMRNLGKSWTTARKIRDLALG